MAETSVGPDPPELLDELDEPDEPDEPDPADPKGEPEDPKGEPEDPDPDGTWEEFDGGNAEVVGEFDFHAAWLMPAPAAKAMRAAAATATPLRTWWELDFPALGAGGGWVAQRGGFGLVGGP